MRTICRLLILASVLILPALAWSHGDAAHIMGTVTAMGTDHVVIQTTIYGMGVFTLA